MIDANSFKFILAKNAISIFHADIPADISTRSDLFEILQERRRRFFEENRQRNKTISMAAFGACMLLILGSWCGYFWGVATGNNSWAQMSGFREMSIIELRYSCTALSYFLMAWYAYNAYDAVGVAAFVIGNVQDRKVQTFVQQRWTLALGSTVSRRKQHPASDRVLGAAMGFEKRVKNYMVVLGRWT